MDRTFRNPYGHPAALAIALIEQESTNNTVEAWLVCILDTILPRKPELKAFIFAYLNARDPNKRSDQNVNALAGSRTAGKVLANGAVEQRSPRRPLFSGRRTRKGSKTFSKKPPARPVKKPVQPGLVHPADHEEREPAASPTKPRDNDPDTNESGGQEQEVYDLRGRVAQLELRSAKYKTRGGERGVERGPMSQTAEVPPLVEGATLQTSQSMLSEDTEAEEVPETTDEDIETEDDPLAKQLSNLRKVTIARPMALQSGGSITPAMVGEVLQKTIPVDKHALTLACLLFNTEVALDCFSTLLDAVHERTAKTPVKPISFFDTISDAPPALNFLSSDNKEVLLSSDSLRQMRVSFNNVRDVLKSKHLDEVLLARFCYTLLLCHKDLTKAHQTLMDERKKAKQPSSDSYKATAASRAYTTLAGALKNLTPLPGQKEGVGGLGHMLDYGKLVECARELLGDAVLYIWPSGFSLRRTQAAFRATFKAVIDYLHSHRVHFPREDIYAKIRETSEFVRKGDIEQAIDEFDRWKGLQLHDRPLPRTPGQEINPRLKTLSATGEVSRKRGYEDFSEEEPTSSKRGSRREMEEVMSEDDM